MKRYSMLLFILGILVSLNLKAQDPEELKKALREASGIFIMDDDIFFLPVSYYNLSKYDILDSTRFIVFYNHTYLNEPAKSAYKEELMKLQVGRKTAKFYSQKTFMDDTLYTENKHRGVTYSQAYEVFQDIPGTALTETHRMPLSETQVALSYEEPLPRFNWQITDEKEEVLGYSCRKATTSYGGREWTVFFTTEIPVSLGPWKLSGLPGLILKAEDGKKQYVFECAGIQQVQEPIYRYRWKYKKMTKKEWQKFDKKLHDAPYSVLNPSGKRMFLTPSSGPFGKKEDWTLFYNPIEFPDTK